MLKPAVQVHEERGVLVAEFWDCLRLDPAPIRDLKREFEAHTRRGGRPVVVVDLTGVGFAGSAALGGFLALRRLGGSLVFCGVEPTVLEVFRVSRILPLFRFATDRAEALALALKEPDPGAVADSAAPPPSRPAPSGPPPLRRSRKAPPEGGPTP